jgi:hypothetical protein
METKRVRGIKKIKRETTITVIAVRLLLHFLLLISQLA